MESYMPDTPPMDMQSAERAAVPALMIQKKGEPQVFYIPLSKINCWEDLVTSIHHLYTFSFSSPPAIITFEGDVVNPKNYLQFMKPNTHLLLSFPVGFQASKNSLRRMSEHLSPRMMSMNSSYSIAFMKKDPTGGAASVQTFSPYSPSRAFRNELERAEAQERRLEEQRLAAHVKAREDVQRFTQYSMGSRAMSEKRTFSSSMATPMSTGLSPLSGSGVHPGRRASLSSQSSVSHSTMSYLPEESYRHMSHSLTPATEVEYYPETGSGWSFLRSPNVWYPSGDPWTAIDAKKEQQRLGILFPSPESPMPEDIDPPTSELQHQTYPAPVLPSYSTENMQLAPGFPVSNIIQQVSAQAIVGGIPSPKLDAEDGTSSIRSQSPLDAQWDRIETPQSSSVLLCPHITFHCVKPIDLKIRLTPTVTVIPPTDPLEHDRMFATAIGDHVNLTMSIEGNGKITRVISEPENTKTPEKITLLKKSQAKGAGGKWYISRMETQLEGGWGSAEVGELGGHGEDGKRRNPGIMLDWSFKGEQNEKRSFAVAYEKLSAFLDLFMDTCGFPKRERQTMINFWARRLPQEPSKNEFLLIKLLPVKDLITLLPIQTDPPPDRTVRFFIIIRRATREIVRKEGLQVRGEMARVVYEVLGSKPPPIVPATKKRRGRGKAKGKGPHGDSNAAMREAERPAGPDPNPRVPIEGGTGLTIFEYGGVLMASQEADEQMAEEALALSTAEAAAAEEEKEIKTRSSPSSPPRKALSHQPTVEEYAEPTPPTANMDVDQPVLTEATPAAMVSPQDHYAILPDTQTSGIQMSDFASQAPEEVISSIYYNPDQPFYDPFMYSHQDMELHDPNQPVFTVVGTNAGYGGGFFQTAHQHPQGQVVGNPMQAQAWGWHSQYE
ncbi:hypothetical protein TWF569_010435 [Orbilia oligospora]|nr:hypothetical protein TWF103_010296 [Orbilia oligospora]KAF3133457.1 hypothetical protein TWF569_010435 [Orbilia oligospora]